MVRKKTQSLAEFSKLIYDLQKSDRYSLIVVAGDTGEGKSTFMIQLMREYAKSSGVKWGYENMTWERNELVKWISGDKDGKGQAPEYSGIVADELISMIYRRNWYEEGQKGFVELLNKCRDRHLVLAGAIPDMSDADSGFMNRVRFYIYIPRGRSKAWVFEPEDNPWTKDKWNVKYNEKQMRKYKGPGYSPNYVCEIDFKDLSKDEKKKYIQLRNSKRKNTENQEKKNVVEKYGKIKKHRNSLIRALFAQNPKLTNPAVVAMLDGEMGKETIRLIRQGILV